MDPATALLALKALLAALPLVTQQVEIFRKRGEYSDAEWAAVQTMKDKWKHDPAWKEEPDPTS